MSEIPVDPISSASSRRRGVSIPHERILLGLLFALEIGAVILAGVAIKAWLLG